MSSLTSSIWIFLFSSLNSFSLCTVISFGGSTLVEAALWKIPVIAFDIEWHSELIRNGETGYLTDYSSSEHLAEALLKSIRFPEKSKDMA